MTDKAISPLRRRLIEDMAIRRLSPKTQLHYIRHVKRFADFLGRSADKATAEDVHRYQLWLASIGTTVPTVNVSATALRFFFKITLKRRDLAEEVVSTREPRRLPVVLSPEEIGRLLASAKNIKHKALLSLAYATGLRASEVVSLKLTDIDSDRMVMPGPVADIAYQNKSLVYDLLLKTAAETLITIAADPKHLGAQIGLTAVLHTWGSALTHHPHAHIIVPGGGLSPDGEHWIACRPGFFLPVRVLSRLFRHRFLEALEAAHHRGQLQFFGAYTGLADPATFARWLTPLRA